MTNPTASTTASESLAEYRLAPHERVRVLRRTPELLEAEVSYEPGTKGPVAHRHPRQTERFVVLQGRVRMTVDGHTSVLAPGDTATIERGQSHTMGADGDEPAKMTWQTRPALDTEGWWAGLDGLMTTYGGEPPLPAIARLLRGHHQEFTLALPGPLARLAVELLALLPARGKRAR